MTSLVLGLGLLGAVTAGVWLATPTPTPTQLAPVPLAPGTPAPLELPPRIVEPPPPPELEPEPRRIAPTPPRPEPAPFSEAAVPDAPAPAPEPEPAPEPVPEPEPEPEAVAQVEFVVLPPAPAAPDVAGVWVGTAGGRPLTLRITTDGSQVTAIGEITQGTSVRSVSLAGGWEGGELTLTGPGGESFVADPPTGAELSGIWRPRAGARGTRWDATRR